MAQCNPFLIVHTTHFTFAFVWMIKHQLQVVSFGNLVELTWRLFNRYLKKDYEHLPSQYFSTSEVIKFVVCLLPFISGRIYIIINEQLGIWHKLWLTPCLMLVKKNHQFFFCFVVFFFMGHMSYVIYKCSCTAKKESER